jgi:hypothetical protein
MLGMFSQFAAGRTRSDLATVLRKAQNEQSGYWGCLLSDAPHASLNLRTTLWAALGLAALERGGSKASTATWDRLLAGIVEQQKTSGSWGYAWDPPQKRRAHPILAEIGTSPLGTFWGMATLQIADSLGEGTPRSHVIRAKKRGIRRLKSDVPKYLRWFREDDSVGNAGHVLSASDGWNFYGVYVLVLACSYSSLERVGSTDWYVEVCRELVKKQLPDGGWGELRSRRGLVSDPASTAFALLCLCRAFDVTHPWTPAPLDVRPPQPLTRTGK